MPKGRRTIFEHANECIFAIDGNCISYVESFSHLGHLITSNCSDDEDINRRRNDFIGQVNNTVCYFRKLDSFVKYNLFCAYCTSYYGCELWLLSNNYLEDFSTTWRKSIRKVLSLSPRTHSILLPVVCHCIPVFDEFCRRSLNFIRSCTSHESALIRFIAYYGVTFFRGFSVLGQNISFCTYRYDCSLFDVLYGSINNTVHSYVADSVSDINLCYGNFLTELIMIRDGILSISDNITTDELNIIIDFICTSQLAL